ncbi:MAG TPA: hypothetical protein VF271_02270 [Rhodanobacteraceae bacterium]
MVEGFNVVAKRQPFDGETVFAQFQAGMTIAEALGDQVAHSASVVVGGHEIPRALWGKVRPKAGKSVEVILYPQGGGSASKWIRIVALVVITYFSAGVAAGAWGTALTGTTAGVVTGASAAWAAGFSALAMMALNTLVPPPTAKGLGGAGSDPFSQLNSLTGTSNQASPYGVIPCVVGRFRFMPALAALPQRAVELQPGQSIEINGRRYWQPERVPGQVPLDRCIHEAGHAIAAWWCGAGVKRVHVDDVGLSVTEAATAYMPAQPDARKTWRRGQPSKRLDDIALREMIYAAAGPMAEGRLKGLGLDWRVMALDPGYQLWKPGDPPSDLHAWQAASLIPHRAHRQRVAAQAMMMAALVLSFYWPAVEALASALQERRTLTGAEVLAVIGEQKRQRYCALTLRNRTGGVKSLRTFPLDTVIGQQLS